MSVIINTIDKKTHLLIGEPFLAIRTVICLDYRRHLEIRIDHVLCHE